MRSTALLIYCTAHTLFSATSSSYQQCPQYGDQCGSLTINLQGNPSPSPLSFRSSTAKYVKTATNLTFIQYSPETAQYTIRNDGSTIRVIPGSNTFNYITGGLLPKNAFFVLVEIRFFWINNYQKFCCDTIDNNGTPLATEIVYKKINGTGEGYTYAIVRNRVKVEGRYDNAKFNEFGKVLSKLTRAGSSTVQSGTTRLFAWVGNTANYGEFYYGYEGSRYIFNSNNTQMYGVFYLTSPKHASDFLSVCQFRLWEAILNYSGTYANPIEPPYPADQINTTIYQAVGYSLVQRPGLPNQKLVG